MSDILTEVRPFLPAIETAVIGGILVYLIHRQLHESVMKSFVRLLNELSSAAERKKEPTAINFYFGMTLVFIFFGIELPGAVHEIFVRPTDDFWTSLVVFIVFLAVFFICSLAIVVIYENSRKSSSDT